MATAIRMPALGQTSDELRLVAWLKAAGETVDEGEALFEAESDKAVHEVESAYSGTLLSVLCEVDEVVKAGTVMGWLGEPGEPVPGVTPPGKAASDDAASPSTASASAAPAPEGDRLAATPAARRVARERGVELSTVTGTGPNGRIESRDVLVAAVDPGPAAPAGAADEPVPPHRRAIAERLHRGLQAPQFAVSRTVDARSALARVAAVQRATLTHLLLQAIGSALAEQPSVNRVWIEDGPHYRRFEQANVGLLIAAEDRLVVATITEPHLKDLADLAQGVTEVASQGRDRRLGASANAPAAVSLSNLGMFGVDRFEAIVDPDQTAILAVGRVIERPAVTAEGIVAVPQLDLTLSVDHRTVDGALAGRFLAAVCAFLED
jgi:pyruvate dehydrogenase E2 component (dihydrolipoamide acetyltransferase)